MWSEIEVVMETVSRMLKNLAISQNITHILLHPEWLNYLAIEGEIVYENQLII
jgi:hypothetical protein